MSVRDGGSDVEPLRARLDALPRLMTDGQLINPKPAGGTEGDIDGSGIRNGNARVVKAGDVVFIPAGVPHQITAVNGEVQFLLFRWDTK